MPKLGNVLSNIKNNTVTSEALELKLECSSSEEYKLLGTTNNSAYNRRIGFSDDSIFFSNSPNQYWGYLYGLRLANNYLYQLPEPYDDRYKNYSTCVIDDYVYIITGCEFYKVNLKTASKTSISKTTTYCSDYSSLIVEGNIIHNITNNPFSYNTETGEFSTTKYSSIISRTAASVAISDEFLYIVGGEKTTKDIVEKVNRETGEIVFLNKIPVMCTLSGASIMNGYLWVYGGSLGDKIYKMDLETEQWELHSSVLPVSNSAFGYCEKDGWIYMIGGTAQKMYKMRFGENPKNIEIRYNLTSDGTEPETPTEIISEEETGVFQNISFPLYTVCSNKNCELIVYDDKIYIPARDSGVSIYSLKNQTINIIQSGVVSGLIYLGGDYLYAFGYSAGVHYIYKINLKTNTTVTTLTNPVGEFSPAYSYTSIGNVGYIAAGQSLYKLENDVITLIEGVSIPININYGYVVSDKKKYLYMVSKTSTICYRYNTETKEFAQLPDIPYVREAPALNVVGDYLYYIGGRVGDRGSNMFIKLNLLNLQTWETETSLRTNGAYINSCVYENYIYSFTESFGTYYPRQFWKYLPIGQVKKTRTGNIYTSPISISDIGNYKLKVVAFKK